MSKTATARAPLESAPFALIAACQYSDKLKRYLSRRIQKHQDVDDLAQQVYLKLLRVTCHVEVPLRFVYGVASKVVADHWASMYRETEHFPSAGEAQDVCANLASESLADRPDEQLDVQQQLELALQSVSPMQAAVVVLIDRDEMSQEEVAEELGLSAHTVKKYATQARARIRMDRQDGGRSEVRAFGK
jgi:RNA polymerase sigma-19 factor, ECF subfamily